MTVHKWLAKHRLLAGCVIGITLSFLSLAAQSPSSSNSAGTQAVVQGYVNDAQGHPLPGAQVHLMGEAGILLTQSDSLGAYQFSKIAKGTYRIRVEFQGFQTGSAGPFTLAQAEAKRIDFHLQPNTHAQTALGAPEFFDQPQFTISGVTDTTNLGGHASAMRAPAADSLSKEIVPLGATRPAPASNAALEQAARVQADNSPGDFQANHSAGRLLLENRKPRDAMPYLQRASRIQPKNYDNSYLLAQAYAAAGDYASARALIANMLAGQNRAELHHLLANVEEKSGHALEAEREYQQAAKLDPSETNLFDWGLELLTHRAVEPAMEVFRNGQRRFPQSARMMSGLAVASYDAGAYDQALQQVCEAADLNPGDPVPYLLLGKMQNADNGQSAAPLARLARFVQLQPENAWANYYYALALWKRRKGPQDLATSTQVEGSLKKAVRLDPTLAQGYFQLGVLYAERKDLPAAIVSYEKAIETGPQLEEAHYRLAQAYFASGQTAKGQQEIERYKAVSKTKAEQIDRDRREIRQFVYTLQAPSADQQQ